METTKLTGAQAVVQSLIKEGVDTIIKALPKSRRTITLVFSIFEMLKSWVSASGEVPKNEPIK